MMGKPKKIWVASEGSYSDYRVIAAFASEELAEAAVSVGMGDGTDDLWYYEDMPTPTLVLIISCMVPTPEKQTERPFGRRFFQEWEHVRKMWPHTVAYDPPPDVRQARFGPSRLSYEGTDFKAVRHAFGEHKSQMQAHWEGVI